MNNLYQCKICGEFIKRKRPSCKKMHRYIYTKFIGKGNR